MFGSRCLVILDDLTENVGKGKRCAQARPNSTTKFILADQTLMPPQGGIFLCPQSHFGELAPCGSMLPSTDLFAQ